MSSLYILKCPVVSQKANFVVEHFGRICMFCWIPGCIFACDKKLSCYRKPRIALWMFVSKNRPSIYMIYKNFPFWFIGLEWCWTDSVRVIDSWLHRSVKRSDVITKCVSVYRSRQHRPALLFLIIISKLLEFWVLI